MKVLFPQSLDFNQTLVFSVFGHLLILTGILFLPKPDIPEKPIVPAFMVSLVSEPSGIEPPAPKPSKPFEDDNKPIATKNIFEKKPAPVKPIKQSPVLKETAPVEIEKVPVVVEAPRPNQALEELSKLEMAITPKGKNTVEELDQLARLETKVQAQPVKPARQKPITEKSFRELEDLKRKKIKDKKVVATVPARKDILEDFEELKMEESLTPVKETSPAKRPKPVLEKQKFERPEEAYKVDLLKELEQLAKLDAAPVPVPRVEKKKNRETAESTKKNGALYEPIIEKFDSLSVDSEPVTVEVSRARIKPSNFRSKLRSLPKTPSTASQPGAKDSYVVSDKEGAPGADAKSLYVGMIQEKIYKNWREPLAEEHNQETVVSFFIFPGGNIDKPFVKKSSGVEVLDTLAVRAVLDSVLFPKFPKELKMSNLHVNIYFKYVPKDE